MRFLEGKNLKIGLFKYLLIFFCLALASQNAISQNNLDSLKSLIPNLEGEQRLTALLNLSYAYYNNSDLENYFKYAQIGFEYALSDGDSINISRFLIERGYYHKYKSEFQEALNDFSRSIDILDVIGEKRLLSAAYTGLGSVYHEMSLYDKALDYHSKSLAIKEQTEDRSDLGVSYNNLGLIYYKIDDLITYTTDPEDELLFYMNTGAIESKGLGIEFDAKWESGPP